MVMMILAASKLLLMPVDGASGLLAAMGHVRVTAVITLVEAITNLCLSIFFVLVLKWGVAGVASGTFFARLFVRTLFMPWYTCDKLGLSLSRFAVNMGGTADLRGRSVRGSLPGLANVDPNELMASLRRQLPRLRYSAISQ